MIHPRMIERVDAIIQEIILLLKSQDMFAIAYQQKKTVPATLNPVQETLHCQQVY